MSGDGRRLALVLSPHPDDELLGCPAHLFALRDAGWRIVNVALSLGAPGQRRRRRAELTEACRRAGFELLPAPAELALGDRGDGGSFARAGAALGELIDATRPALLVAPTPHDTHPAHERAGRLALAAVREAGPERLWLWALWGDVEVPNSLCEFDERRLAEIAHALAAHAGELARNDYRTLLEARARLAAVRDTERVFGFGSPGPAPGALAESLCELVRGSEGELLLARPHRFATDEEPVTAGDTAADQWLDRPSARALAGRLYEQDRRAAT